MGWSNLFRYEPAERATSHIIDEPIDTGGMPIQHMHGIGIQPAKRLPIVTACLQRIIDMISEATPEVRTADGRVLRDEMLPSWIRDPSLIFDLDDFIAQAVWTLLVEGSDLFVVVHRVAGEPFQIRVASSNEIGISYSDGTVTYKSRINDAILEVVHIRRFALPGDLNSLQVLDSARSLLNSALHAQDMLEEFFANHARIDLVLSPKEPIPLKGRRDLMRQFAARSRQRKTAYRPIAPGYHVGVERITDTNRDSQILELMRDLSARICQEVFHIDPRGMGFDTSGTALTYTNVSHLRTQVWMQACTAIARKIASAISALLPPGSTFHFDPTELLMGGPADRAMLIEKMALTNKHMMHEIFSGDDMRKVFGMPPLGDYEPLTNPNKPEVPAVPTLVPPSE